MIISTNVRNMIKAKPKENEEWGVQMGFGFRVSGFGFRVSGFGVVKDIVFFDNAKLKSRITTIQAGRVLRSQTRNNPKHETRNPKQLKGIAFERIIPHIKELLFFTTSNKYGSSNHR